MGAFEFRARQHSLPTKKNLIGENDLSDTSGALFVGKITRWGHSLAIRVPRDVLKEAELEEGSIVDVELTKRHVLEIEETEGAVMAFCEKIAASIGWPKEEVQYLLLMSAVFENYEKTKGSLPINEEGGERQRERFEEIKKRVMEFREQLRKQGFTVSAQHIDEK